MADQLSLRTRAVKLPLEDLPALQMPAILHWDMNHFVVVEKATKRRALIHDPAGASGWRAMNDVSRHFTGVALELAPTEDFEPGIRREGLRLRQLWTGITGLKRTLAQIVVLSLVLQAFILASPYYLQVALDDAVPARDGSLVVTLAVGFGLFTILNAGATFLRSLVLMSAGTTLSFTISSNIARRLFRLPVDWFEKRHTGDVLSRFQSVAPIRQFLVEGAVGAVLDGALTALTLMMMAIYSWRLTCVALAGMLAYAALRASLYPAQRRAQEEAIINSGREQTTMIETLRGIVTLRLYNREALRHSLWQSRLVDSMNATAAMARLTAFQTAGNGLIAGLESVASIAVAVRAVIGGDFTIGMVFAFMAYKSQFILRTTSLIDQASAFSLLGLHLIGLPTLP